jgi:hypothetical protein
MRLGLTWMLAVVAACSGDGGSGPGDDDDDTGAPLTECSPKARNDLDDIYALQRDDRFCEDAQYYNPAVPTATLHWFSELTIDGCGAVTGYETALFFPNQTLSDGSGVADCEIVWLVSGTVDEAAIGGADYGLNVELTLDVVQTTCDPNPFEDIITATVHYNVSVDEGVSRFFFDSGTEFAQGYGNEAHLSWFFDECKLF